MIRKPSRAWVKFTAQSAPPIAVRVRRDRRRAAGQPPRRASPGRCQRLCQSSQMRPNTARDSGTRVLIFYFLEGVPAMNATSHRVSRLALAAALAGAVGLACAQTPPKSLEKPPQLDAVPE